MDLLIVDDNPLNRKLLRAQLEAEGHLVLEAPNGAAALDALEHARVDGIVSDILMPVLDGFRLCLEIRNSDRFAALPFVLYTSTYESPQDRDLARDVGADAYISKPSPVADVVRALEQARRATRARTPEVSARPGEAYVLQQYSEALVHKLEERNIAIEEALRIAEAANQELRAAEAKFRALIEGSYDAISMLAADGRVLYRSPAASRILGYPTDEMLGHQALDLVHPEDLPAARGILATILSDPSRPVHGTVRYRHHDGGWRWLEGTATNLLSHPDVGAIIVNHRDVTAERIAEDARRESERRFSAMLANVDLIALMLDSSAHVTYCNDYLLRLTGWRHEEVIGRDWFELFLPPPHEETRVLFASLLADRPEAWHHENEIVTRSGERRLIHWNNTVLRSAGGAVIGTASIAEDITERRFQEIRIRRLLRIRAFSSDINSAVVRIHERGPLFQETCRIAVERGEFRMAWVGVLDRDSGRLVPAAWVGIEDDVVPRLRITASEDVPEGRGVGGNALRTLQPAWENDLAADSGLNPARGLVVERGARSVIALPLIVDGGADAVLVLYSAERGVFTDDEVGVLTELAADVSFALQSIARREQVEYLSYYDSLTGLPNRTLFLDRLGQQLHGRSSQPAMVALILLDVERVRYVNDTLGRTSGDALLVTLAHRLESAFQGKENIARVGGDEFAVVVRGLRDAADVLHLLENRVLECLREPFMISETELRVSVRAGVALYPADGADSDSLFQNAEAALDRARRSGERYLFYAADMNARVADALLLETRLRKAVEQRQFVLHYQPKFRLADGTLSGMEALIRWQMPGGALVPPGAFIPMLEDTGMILEVGRWAIRHALAEHHGWRERGLAPPRIAVNVSSKQLERADFVDTVVTAVQNEGDDPEALELEITESLLMRDVRKSNLKLTVLRGMGITLAMDDFGTGYSSLTYLARLPIDTLKIDRSFITALSGGEQDRAIVATIITLAHSLGLKVVAEGVETDEQSRLLASLHCDQAQGYLFARPMPARDIEELLAARRRGAGLPGADGTAERRDG